MRFTRTTTQRFGPSGARNLAEAPAYKKAKALQARIESTVSGFKDRDNTSYDANNDRGTVIVAESPSFIGEMRYHRNGVESLDIRRQRRVCEEGFRGTLGPTYRLSESLSGHENDRESVMTLKESKFSLLSADSSVAWTVREDKKSGELEVTTARDVTPTKQTHYSSIDEPQASIAWGAITGGIPAVGVLYNGFHAGVGLKNNGLRGAATAGLALAGAGLQLAALLNRNPMLLGASAAVGGLQGLVGHLADAATFKANAEVEYAQQIKELRNDPQVTES